MQTMLLPNSLLITASYSKDYAKHFGTMVGLVYGELILAMMYAATRFSYTFAGNVVNDYKGSYSCFMFQQVVRRLMPGTSLTIFILMLKAEADLYSRTAEG